jgi:hypothetical protein
MAGRALILFCRAFRFGYFAKVSPPENMSKHGIILAKYKSAQVN